jgi:hypothetical protein
MRRANTDRSSAAQDWALVNDVLDFFSGASEDGGPREFAVLMDQVYGPGVTILGLNDKPLWVKFLGSIQKLLAPQIGSPFVVLISDEQMEKGWRFLGTHTALDATIMENLIYDRVGIGENIRQLPSGLDVAAALGSSTAERELKEAGVFEFYNYSYQMDALQDVLASIREPQWLSNVHTSWLYISVEQLSKKEGLYPQFFGTTAWNYRQLNSALGSWAERRHDISAFVEMPELSSGAGPPASGPAPGYVEPVPQVFYRLGYLAEALATGLKTLDLNGTQEDNSLGLYQLLVSLEKLANHLKGLGDVAVKELEGHVLDEQDYWLIQAPLGPAETRVLYSQRLSDQGVHKTLKMPPMPKISTVATGGERVLQVGVGLVDRIYVIVPLNGTLSIAQGGVYTYYEFSPIAEEAIDNDAWQKLFLTSQTVELPLWTESYMLSDGNPIDVLAFRVGDVYRITLPGNRLTVRDAPSRHGNVIQQMSAGDYVTILDGPVQAEGFTWWKFNLDPYEAVPREGWAVQNPYWYERAWGQ